MDREIARASQGVETPQQMAELLVTLSRQRAADKEHDRHKDDDITAVVIEHGKRETPFTKPKTELFRPSEQQAFFEIEQTLNYAQRAISSGFGELALETIAKAKKQMTKLNERKENSLVKLLTDRIKRMEGSIEALQTKQRSERVEADLTPPTIEQYNVVMDRLGRKLETGGRDMSQLASKPRQQLIEAKNLIETILHAMDQGYQGGFNRAGLQQRLMSIEQALEKQPASIFYKYILKANRLMPHEDLSPKEWRLVALGDPLLGAPWWEPVFQLPVLLASAFGLSWLVVAPLAIVMAVLFGLAHRDRSPPEKIWLSFLGLVFTAAMLLPLSFMDPATSSVWGKAAFLIVGYLFNAITHFNYNVLAMIFGWTLAAINKNKTKEKFADLKGRLEKLEMISADDSENSIRAKLKQIEESVEKNVLRHVFTRDDLLSFLINHKPLVPESEELTAIKTPWGVIDLTRLNNIDQYKGELRTVQIARDLELAHTLGLIKITPMAMGISPANIKSSPGIFNWSVIEKGEIFDRVGLTSSARASGLGSVLLGLFSLLLTAVWGQAQIKTPPVAPAPPPAKAVTLPEIRSTDPELESKVQQAVTNLTANMQVGWIPLEHRKDLFQTFSDLKKTNAIKVALKGGVGEDLFGAFINNEIYLNGSDVRRASIKQLEVMLLNAVFRVMPKFRDRKIFGLALAARFPTNTVSRVLDQKETSLRKYVERTYRHLLQPEMDATMAEVFYISKQAAALDRPLYVHFSILSAWSKTDGDKNRYYLLSEIYDPALGPSTEEERIDAIYSRVVTPAALKPHEIEIFTNTAKGTLGSDDENKISEWMKNFLNSPDPTLEPSEPWHNDKETIKEGAQTLVSILLSISKNKTGDAVARVQGLVDLNVSDPLSAARTPFLQQWDRWSKNPMFIDLLRKELAGRLKPEEVTDNALIGVVLEAIGYSTVDKGELAEFLSNNKPRIYILKGKIDSELIIGAIRRTGVYQLTQLVVENEMVSYFAAIATSINKIAGRSVVTVRGYERGNETGVGLRGSEFDPGLVQTQPLGISNFEDALFILGDGINYNGPAKNVESLLKLLPEADRLYLKDIGRIMRQVLSAA